MDAKSGSGRFGTFIWGLIAGLIALIAAGGLYLSGILGSGGDETPAETAEVTPPAQQGETPEQPQDTAVATQDSTPTTEEAAEADETPVSDPVDDAEPAEEQTAEAPAAPAPAAPVLDQIFVEPDGTTLLSGNADPGAEVDVVLDGETIHSFTVDATGQFAEFVVLPFANAGRGLALEARDGDQSVRSDDYLIAALPEPEPEPAPAEAVQTPAEEVAETEVATADPLEKEQQPPVDAQPEVAESPAEAAPEPEADQQVAVLRSGEEGVELVQPPAAPTTPPDQVALDTIGYSDSGDVELSGRTQEGSGVRLYLDNRLVADLPPSEDGKWRGELDDIDPGVYTLRVDEVDPDGAVVSRIETPFKREPVEALQVAENPDEPAAEVPPIRAVTVQKGDTLWAISRERFGDGILYVKLFDANRDSIRDPDLIYPGQIFTIPE